VLSGGGGRRLVRASATVSERERPAVLDRSGEVIIAGKVYL
jgi:hypothetical protein